MPTFDTINYSLRPNKAIQRQIVFDGLEFLDRHVPIRNALYVGFGSIWFSDFVLAHKRLGITDMISIENKAIGAVRAKFNAPFRTVQIEEGDSTPVLEDIAAREQVLEKQWIVWLDYDLSITQTTLDDIGLVLTHAPPNSVLLVTFDAGGLGMSASKRENYLRDLLQDAVPDDLPDNAFEKDNIPTTFARCLLDYIQAEAANRARPGGFIPAFNIPYTDSAPMVTVGGFLLSPAARGAGKACIQAEAWDGFARVPVEAPPLTIKEVAALQRLLPSASQITRAGIQEIGFDLTEDQLAAYVEHYRRYPAFFQVVA